MLCYIWKASDDKNKPCKTARQITALKHGFTTLQGHSVPDAEKVIWVVEINTIEDLNAIIAETNPCGGVVYNVTNESGYSVDGIPLGEVIIYDGYIE